MDFIQKFDGKNVLERAQENISFVFDNFKTINVSISGGKDSTVLAHLVLVEAQRRNRKIGLLFLDEEVVYQSTIDQINYLMGLQPDNTNRLWIQIEFRLTNAISLSQPYLTCWERGKHTEWMRSKKAYAIKERMWDKKDETIRNKNIGFDFYDLIENFERTYTDTAFLVGLRGVEHPNRWRTISKNPQEIGMKHVHWATQKGDNYALYPLYDWNFTDVWKYIHDNGIEYSKTYDRQFQMGLGINEIRLSSLIHEKSFKSLVDLPAFEPKTYEALCRRVKGIEFAQETGKNSKMFKVRKLPKNYKSWLVYRDFLLGTYPDHTKKIIFETRFNRQKENEFVGRQQCRQLILNDYENNLPIKNMDDPRDELIRYYQEML